MTTRTALALVLVILGFALAGCGLSPVYGTYSNAGRNPSVANALDQVYIDTVPDRTGQKLRNLLIDRFYKTGQKSLAEAQYRLQITGLSENIYGLGIAKDATATRSQIKLTATMTLTRRDDTTGKPALVRNLTAVSSFNTLASQYTTLVTEEDARDMTIRDLADQATTLTELYFASPAAYPQPKTQAERDETMANRLRREHDLENDYNERN